MTSLRRRMYRLALLPGVSTGVAMKIDEYAPEAMPTSSANAKSCSVSPPNSISARTGSRVHRARDERSREHLGHRAVRDLGERGARHARHVLAYSVEHDDRVVERVAQDGEQRGDRRRRHLPVGQGVHARRDQEVVRSAISTGTAYLNSNRSPM